MGLEPELRPVESSGSGLALRIFACIVGASGLGAGAIWALTLFSTMGKMGIWQGIGIALIGLMWAALLGTFASIREHAEVTAMNSATQVKQLNRLIKLNRVPEAPFKEM